MGLQSKMLTGWVIGFEEEAGVMRNAMTTRAPGGAKKTKKYIFSLNCVFVEKERIYRSSDM